MFEEVLSVFVVVWPVVRLLRSIVLARGRVAHALDIGLWVHAVCGRHWCAGWCPVVLAQPHAAMRFSP